MVRFVKFWAVTLLVAGAVGLPTQAYACEPLVSGEPSAASATTKDSGRRAVVPISINGQGPFRFIIDTGANRSVISRGLATRLGLEPSGHGVVHSIVGIEPAVMVNVDSISFGDLHLSRGEIPILEGPMLDDAHGLLGVDGMAGRLLYVDFTKHCVEVYESPAQVSMDGWLSVPARMRFGTMLSVQGEIQGVKVNVLIDTGSDVSLGNERFREALRGVAARSIQYRNGHAFTFGRPVLLEQSVWTPTMLLGNTIVNGVTAYIGDFHVFDVWGLQNEPTMLIGMDVLARSLEMAIDYERGTVHFRKRPRGKR